MRGSRVFASLAVAAATSASMLAFAAPAAAYPPVHSCQATISDTTPARGASVTASAGCFQSGEQVNGNVHSATVFVGSTTANSNGRATLTFTVPSSLPTGHHTLELIGQTSGHVATEGFTLTRSAANTTRTSSGSGLPFTGGSDIWPMTAAGVGLVLVGGAAIAVVRRRRHSGLAA